MVVVDDGLATDSPPWQPSAHTTEGPERLFLALR